MQHGGICFVNKLSLNLFYFAGDGSKPFSIGDVTVSPILICNDGLTCVKLLHTKQFKEELQMNIYIKN